MQEITYSVVVVSSFVTWEVCKRPSFFCEKCFDEFKIFWLFWYCYVQCDLLIQSLQSQTMTNNDNRRKSFQLSDMKWLYKMSNLGPHLDHHHLHRHMLWKSDWGLEVHGQCHQQVHDCNQALWVDGCEHERRRCSIVSKHGGGRDSGHLVFTNISQVNNSKGEPV